MRSDRLKQFISLRESLLKEKVGLEQRLQQINEVLKADAEGGGFGALKLSSLGLGGRGGKRIRNKMSLREAVRQVTSRKALTKQEILDAIGKLGYRFTSSNPINSLNAVLYANRQFKNDGGRFSPK